MSADSQIIRTIYFLQAGARGPLKIGLTDNLRNRLRLLRGHFGQHLVLLASVCGSRDEELRIHRYARPWQIAGEWYSPADEITELARYAATTRALPHVEAVTLPPSVRVPAVEKIRQQIRLLTMIAEAA